MKARVYVSPKPTVLDPQGQAIRKALNAHGHASVADVRQGKYFDVALEGVEAEKAKTEIETIARDVLANPVIEDYRIEILD
jgi:phosphoribosylformylglycinamidine synthase